MLSVDRGSWTCAPVCWPAGVERIDLDVVAPREQRWTALLVTVFEAHQQVMLHGAGFHHAGQVDGVGGGPVTGGLPGVVLVQLAGPGAGAARRCLTGCVAVGTQVHMVEVLVSRTAAGHPANFPVFVEVVAQVRAQHLQLVFHEVSRPGKTRADGHPGRQVRIRRPTVRHPPHLVPGVLAQPAQPGSCIHQNAGRHHGVPVANAMAEAVCLLAVGRQAHGHMAVQHVVHVHRAAHVLPRAAPQRHAAAGIEARLLADHVDDAAARAATIEHGGRPLQDFDALHVGRAAAHLTALADAIAEDVVVVGLETPDGDAFTPHVVGRAHPRYPVEHDRQVIDAVALGLAYFHRIDGLRDVLWRQVGFGGGGHAFRPHVVRIEVGRDANGGQRGGARMGVQVRVAGSAPRGPGVFRRSGRIGRCCRDSRGRGGYGGGAVRVPGDCGGPLLCLHGQDQHRQQAGGQQRLRQAFQGEGGGDNVCRS